MYQGINYLKWISKNFEQQKQQKKQTQKQTKLEQQSLVHHGIYPLLIFYLDHGVTNNIAQYPLHHVTYAPAKFEVAMSNGLGGDKYTKIHYLTLTLASRSHEILPSTLYIMRPMHLQRLKLLRPTVK